MIGQVSSPNLANITNLLRE